MSKLSIFEPAMCCETGLCGVGVDPELLRISTVFHTLKKSGIDASRFNLTSTPKEFVTNKEINLALNHEGVAVLPITVVDGNIVKKGSYPTNEELTSWLGLQSNVLADGLGETKEDCGCGSDVSCCSDGESCGCEEESCCEETSKTSDVCCCGGDDDCCGEEVKNRDSCCSEEEKKSEGCCGGDDNCCC